MVIVVSDFLHGSVSQQISQLLSDLQPLECHVFCSQSEEMHAQLIPMSEGEGLDYSLGGYSHFGEFQALMRKWISREVRSCLTALAAGSWLLSPVNSLRRVSESQCSTSPCSMRRCVLAC